MKSFIYLSVLCLAFFTLASCSTYFFHEPCPVGYSPGDSWPIEGCGRCICDENGYQCSDCGVVELQDYPGCYYEASTSTSYPECCFQDLKCRGDDDFNEEKYSRVRHRNHKKTTTDQAAVQQNDAKEDSNKQHQPQENAH